jgi:hypothetical protein
MKTALILLAPWVVANVTAAVLYLWARERL